ncbi:hypothetical protein ACFL59_03780 [Planctomycetota bacterium]
MRSLSVLAVLLAAFLLCMSVFASPEPEAPDTVFLTDGRTIQCRILEETDEGVRVSARGIEHEFSWDDIDRIQRRGDLDAELAKRLKATDPSDAEALYELGAWCVKQGLMEQAQEVYGRSLAADPDYEPTRAALGHRRMGGKWYTPEDYKRKVQGYVEWQGKLVPPEDLGMYRAGFVKDADGAWVLEADLKKAAEDTEARKRRTPEATSTAKRIRREADGRFVKRFPNGKPKVEGRKRNGKKHGKWVEYYESGKKKRVAYYYKGELHGVEQRFDEAGELQEERTYVRGRVLYQKSLRLIKKFLARIAKEPIGTPKATAHQLPYGPSETAAQIPALRRVRAYRYLCNLSCDVELSYEYGLATAAAARVLEKVGRLTHTPARPAGLSDVEWKWGKRGCLESNLHQGQANMVGAVDGFMHDSDSSNIAEVGHRRWILNPSMKQTAFSLHGQYVAMYAMDSKGSSGRVDWVAYPAQGYFPVSYLRGDAAWSISFGNGYRRPESVKVRVHPMAANLDQGAPLEIDYLNVCKTAYGLPQCIVFRPKASVSPGCRYWVEIEGVKRSGGAPVPIQYMVEFFDG